MSDVTITIRLPEELADRARKLDALRDEVIIRLLEEEIGRREMSDSSDREKQRDEAILQTYRLFAELDALEPKMTAEEVDEALRKARDSQ